MRRTTWAACCLTLVMLAAGATDTAMGQTPVASVEAEFGFGDESGRTRKFFVDLSANAPTGGLTVKYSATYDVRAVQPGTSCRFERFISEGRLGNQSVRIRAGQRRAEILFKETPADGVLETQVECRGAVEVTLQSGAGYTVSSSDGTATVHIRDDVREGGYIVLARNLNFSEDTGTATVRAELRSCESARPCDGTRLITARVPIYQGIELALGRAIAGFGSQQADEEDLELEVSRVLFEPGKSTVDIPIRINDDAVLEGYLSPDGLAEAFGLQLLAQEDMRLWLRHTTTGNNAPPTVTPAYILDNDTTTLEVLPPTERAHEGDAFEVTVRMAEGTRCEGIANVTIPVTARALVGTEISGGAAGANKTATLSDCDAEATVSFTTTEDTTDERHGFVRVEAAAERLTTGHVVSNSLLRDRVHSDTADIRIYDDDGKGTFLYAGRFDATWVSATTDIDIIGSDAVEYQNGAKSELNLTTSDPPNGTASVTDNKLRYTPDTGFTGHDTFDYTVSDGTLSDTGRVRIEVREANATNWSFSLPDSVAERSSITSTVSSTGGTPSGEVRIVWHVLKSSSGSAADITVKGCAVTGAGPNPSYTCGQVIEPGRGSGNEAYPGEEAWVYISRYSTDSMKNTGDTKLKIEAKQRDFDRDESLEWVAFVNGRKAGTGTTTIDDRIRPYSPSDVTYRKDASGRTHRVVIHVEWDEILGGPSSAPVKLIDGTPTLEFTLADIKPPFPDDFASVHRTAVFSRGDSEPAQGEPDAFTKLGFSYTLTAEDLYYGNCQRRTSARQAHALADRVIRFEEGSGKLVSWHANDVPLDVRNAIHDPELGLDSLQVPCPTGTQSRATVRSTSIGGPDTSGRRDASTDVTVSLTWEREVTVDTGGGTPSVKIRLDGSEERTAGYRRGSGTDTLTFTYRPTGEDGQFRRVELLADSLALNGGSITDGDGNDVDLDHAGASATVERPKGPEADPLTAELRRVPESHDGTATFSFRIRFSENVSISPDNLRQHALELTNGTATKARRVNNRSDRFEVTVRPGGNDAVTIRLVGERTCGQKGAVCTKGSEPQALSESVTATVAGPSLDPLTASFAGVPTEHDGTRFEFEVRFSDDVGISAESLRTDALDVDNGTASEATKVAGRNDRFEVTVVPVGRDSVTITLRGDRACNLSGAVCTAGSNPRRLSNTVSATVEGPPDPLTAEWRSVPAEHDGSSRFSLELHLSENVDDLSFLTLQNGGLEASNGSVARASRLVPGRNQGWKIEVDPDGTDAVTVTAPRRECTAANAICNGDRPLEAPVSATVAGPVGISVDDVSADESDDTHVVFPVSLSRTKSEDVSIDYATSDGTATAGDDYTATSGTLTITSGQTSGTISVPILDDEHDEGSETFTLTLSNPSTGTLTDSTATGTINNHDQMPKALLARFGRATAEQIAGSVEQRLAARRDPGVEVRFGGYTLGSRHTAGPGGTPAIDARGAGGIGQYGRPTHAVGPMGPRSAGPGALTTAGTPAGMEARPGGSGAQPGGYQTDPWANVSFESTTATGAGTLAVWGRRAESHFASAGAGPRTTGALRSNLVGADYARGRTVLGVTVGESQGDGAYAGVSEGRVAASIRGVYPWIGYQASERVAVWSTAGYGSGSLLLATGAAPPLETALTMAMAAAGARAEVATSGPWAVAAKTDALWVRTGYAEAAQERGRLAGGTATAGRVRAGIEASRTLTWRGATLRPSVELGVRRDTGDAETGAGLDAGAGLQLQAAGVTAEVLARRIVVHQAAGFAEQSLSIGIGYDPSPSPLGLSARLAPAWGQTGADQMWGDGPLRTWAGAENTGRLDGEVGYGLALGRSLVGTPTMGLSHSAYGRAYRIGYRIGLIEQGPIGLEVGVDAERHRGGGWREGLDDTGAVHRLLGQARVQW